MAAVAAVRPGRAAAEDMHPIAARLARELDGTVDCAEHAAITGMSIGAEV